MPVLYLGREECCVEYLLIIYVVGNALEDRAFVSHSALDILDPYLQYSISSSEMSLKVKVIERRRVDDRGFGGVHLQLESKEDVATFDALHPGKVEWKKPYREFAWHESKDSCCVLVSNFIKLWVSENQGHNYEDCLALIQKFESLSWMAFIRDYWEKVLIEFTFHPKDRSTTTTEPAKDIYLGLVGDNRFRILEKPEAKKLEKEILEHCEDYCDRGCSRRTKATKAAETGIGAKMQRFIALLKDQSGDTKKRTRQLGVVIEGLSQMRQTLIAKESKAAVAATTTAPVDDDREVAQPDNNTKAFDDDDDTDAGVEDDDVAPTASKRQRL